MSDQFSEIHKLRRAGNNNAALSMLLNKKTGRIKRPYNSDLNHAWYTVGDIYYNCYKYDNAIHAFKKAFRNWSGDIEALWAIANCYSDLGKPWLAKYYLEKAVGLNEKDELRYDLGNAFFDMGRYHDAITQYKKVGNKDKQLTKLVRSNLKKAEKLLKESARLTSRTSIKTKRTKPKK